MTQPRQEPSEFGGRPGLVQAREDGHEPDVPEAAYLLRTSVDSSPFWTDGEIGYDPLPDGVDAGSQLA